MRTSCPEVGRSQRPDLVAIKRGRAALSSSVNPLQIERTTRAHHQPSRRCLTDDDQQRYPKPAFTPPTEASVAPIFATDIGGMLRVGGAGARGLRRHRRRQSRRGCTRVGREVLVARVMFAILRSSTPALAAAVTYPARSE